MAIHQLRLKPLQKVNLISPINGKDGINGRDGIDGLNGKDGLDGHPGVNGRDGIDGKDGLNGRDGIDGERGPQGLRGNKGDPGPRGLKGDRGKDGKHGRNGIDGKDGQRGINGKDGLQGQKGDKGDAPAHRWMGTKLQFQNPDGSWGKSVELKGPMGPPGGGSGWLGLLASPEVTGEVKYAVRLNVVSDTVMYKGEAATGSSEASALWRIARITTNAEGDVTIEWASGTAEFTQVWSNHLALSYS